jgi:hypothetical protein
MKRQKTTRMAKKDFDEKENQPSKVVKSKN